MREAYLVRAGPPWYTRQEVLVLLLGLGLVELAPVGLVHGGGRCGRERDSLDSRARLLMVTAPWWSARSPSEPAGPGAAAGEEAREEPGRRLQGEPALARAALGAHTSGSSHWAQPKSTNTIK